MALQTPAQRKLAREETISSFFDEVDSGKIHQFVKEDSFDSFLKTMRSKALFIQKGLKISGPDRVTFKILFPFELFCACISQCHFDRKADIKFRY